MKNSKELEEENRRRYIISTAEELILKKGPDNMNTKQMISDIE